METAFAWYGKESKLRPLLHLQGEEYIQKAQTEGRGILFIGPHFLTVEIANRLYALDHDISLMYRKSKNDFLNFIIETALKKYNKQIIERNQVYRLIKALKKGENVGYTPDIDGGYYHSIFVPFFNIPASTLTAPTKLAKLTNATVLLSTYYRRDDGTGYDLTFSPVPTDFPSDHIEKDITYINQWLEEVIQKNQNNIYGNINALKHGRKQDMWLVFINEGYKNERYYSSGRQRYTTLSYNDINQ